LHCSGKELDIAENKKVSQNSLVTGAKAILSFSDKKGKSHRQLKI